MPDFLDEKRDEIDDRLAELRPLIEEYNRLQAASAALAEVAGSSGARTAVGTVSPASRAVEEATSAVAESPTAARPEEDVSPPSPAPVRRGPGRPRGSDGGGSGDGDVAEGDATAAGVDPDTQSPPTPRPQPPGLRSAPGSRRAGRPKGSGQRAAEALRIVREQPGVTIPELADRMGIKQNYLYRVLPELVGDGKVVKQGRGWHPRAA